jgi:hypothetical protein
LEGVGTHPASGYTGYLHRNFLIASHDPIAAEAVGAAAMGYNPNDIELCRWGAAKKLGFFQLHTIALTGNTIADVQTYHIAPTSGTQYYGRGCRRWLVNGLYNTADLAAANISEAAADPVANGQDGGFAWTPFYSGQDYVNLALAYPGLVSGSKTGYAFTRIYSGTAQSGLLWVGADRGIKIWVNGSLLVNNTTNTAYDRIGIEVPVSLIAGDNRILVKVNNMSAALGFSLAMVNDGSQTSRTTFRAYASSSGARNLLGRDSSMVTKKKQFFGGRTLFGTIYHLEKTAVGTEHGSLNNQPALLLSQNFPNPFSVQTVIAYTLQPGTHQTALSIYDLHGRRLRSLINQAQVSGGYQVFWNGAGENGVRLPAGIYICRLQAGTLVQDRKIMLAK